MYAYRVDTIIQWKEILFMKTFFIGNKFVCELKTGSDFSIFLHRIPTKVPIERSWSLSQEWRCLFPYGEILYFSYANI